MKYVTISDLADAIRRNLWKVPRDIDFVIGVPRSGMIGASIISSYLNVPLTDIESHVAGIPASGGARLKFFTQNHKEYGKALVVDDTVYAGYAMRAAKDKLNSAGKMIDYTYMCIYLEGNATDAVDFYLEDIRKYTDSQNTIVFYEWNIFQHYDSFTYKMLFDLDGVLCLEPPDDRMEDEYLRYINNATPYIIPRSPIGGIVTYRISKNREITERWLREQGVQYNNNLVMFNTNSRDERNNSGISPEAHKANYYRQHNQYRLFIESSDYQAQRIYEMTRKPVLCVETNKMYQ